MKTMINSGYFSFGEIIPNLMIRGEPAPYRVLNERENRATAGLKMAFGTLAFTNAFFAQNFLILKIVILSFFVEFSIKVLFGPSLAPYSIAGRWLVRNQEPEWVGAVQKRFAWSIGLMMSILMIFIVIVFEITGPLPFTLCAMCVALMWLEASAGICVGCIIYWWTVRRGWLEEPEFAPACAGNSCQVTS